MNLLRSHWYDLGLGLAAIIAIALWKIQPTGLSLILWISLISLLLHQFEEYRFPGTFPGMVNRVMFASPQPDRYPLNSNTALLINVIVGWLTYFLAAMFAEKAVWLAIATILVSVGNIMAHTFLFNIRGRTLYNPGMFTALALFLPIVYGFFFFITNQHLVSAVDWWLGLILGVVLNYFGILKMIVLLQDKNTAYIFPQRNVG